RWSPRRCAGLGLLLGLAFLTKMQSYAAFGAALAALAYDAWRRDLAPRQALTPRQVLGRGALMLGVAALVAAPWLVRNGLVYGWDDLLALRRHDAVVAGQLTTAAHLAQHGLVGSAAAWVITCFRSFWGQFGWMGVVLPARIYRTLALLSGLAALGFAAWLAARRGRFGPAAARAALILGVWAGLAVGGLLWWNTRYWQPQGRYLFGALTPLGIAWALGLGHLLRAPRRAIWAVVAAGLLASLAALALAARLDRFTVALWAASAAALATGRWLDRRAPGLALALLYAGMAALAFYCLHWHVVPALTPG
ncbi:MAG: hypothetical protein V1772_08280, partial [Chloroflexota bacterium]